MMQNVIGGQPMGVPNMQMAEFIQREQIRLSMQQQKEVFNADIEIRKKAFLEMQKADIVAQREMYKTKVLIASGKVYLTKETFRGTLQESLEIEVKENILFVPLEAKYAGAVLKMTVDTGSKHQGCIIWLSQGKLDDRTIRQKFVRAGVAFGFSKGKETEIQKNFLAAALEQSEIKEVPLIHGWYKSDGEFRYAYPETETWREVCRHAE